MQVLEYYFIGHLRHYYLGVAWAGTLSGGRRREYERKKCKGSTWKPQLRLRALSPFIAVLGSRNMDLNWVPENSAASVLRARLGCGGCFCCLATCELLRLAAMIVTDLLAVTTNRNRHSRPEAVRCPFSPRETANEVGS